MLLNWEIENHSCVNSTQDILKERCKNGASQGLVITADEQSKGRGRHGNVWQAPKGNLYMSFLLKPNCRADTAGQYSFLIALALSKAIDAYIKPQHKKQLKWPNDLLIDEKKCAGILLESEINNEGIVTDLYAGVGVNIQIAPSEKVALKDICEHVPSVEEFLESFLESIAKSLLLYDQEGFSSVCTQWLSQAYRVNEMIKVRLPKEALYGVFEGLDDDGTLLLRMDNGELQRITAGEVYF